MRACVHTYGEREREREREREMSMNEAESLAVDDIEEYLKHYDMHKTLEHFRAERRAVELRKTDLKPEGTQQQQSAQSRSEIHAKLIAAVRAGDAASFRDAWCELVPMHLRRFDVETMRIEFRCMLCIATADDAGSPNGSSAPSSQEKNVGIDVFREYLELLGNAGRGATNAGKEGSGSHVAGLALGGGNVDINASCSELLTFYALPFVPEPRRHPGFQKLYEIEWRLETVAQLEAFLASTGCADDPETSDAAEDETKRPRIIRVYERLFVRGADEGCIGVDVPPPALAAQIRINRYASGAADEDKDDAADLLSQTRRTQPETAHVSTSDANTATKDDTGGNGQLEAMLSGDRPLSSYVRKRNDNASDVGVRQSNNDDDGSHQNANGASADGRNMTKSASERKSTSGAAGAFIDGNEEDDDIVLVDKPTSPEASFAHETEPVSAVDASSASALHEAIAMHRMSCNDGDDDDILMGSTTCALDVGHGHADDHHSTNDDGIGPAETNAASEPANAPASHSNNNKDEGHARTNESQDGLATTSAAPGKEEAVIASNVQLDYAAMHRALRDSSDGHTCALLQAIRFLVVGRKASLPVPSAGGQGISTVTTRHAGHDRKRIVLDIVTHDLFGLSVPASSSGRNDDDDDGKEHVPLIPSLLASDRDPAVLEQTSRLLSLLSASVAGRKYLARAAPSALLVPLCRLLVSSSVGSGGNGGINASIDQHESPCFQSALGALQRLSLLRSAARVMIAEKLVPWTVVTLRSSSSNTSAAAHRVSEYSLEFVAALMMNLSLLASGRVAAAADAEKTLAAIVCHLESGNEQVRTYINGTLYSLLRSPRFHSAAVSLQVSVGPANGLGVASSPALGLHALLLQIKRRSSFAFATQIEYIVRKMAEPLVPKISSDDAAGHVDTNDKEDGHDANEDDDNDDAKNEHEDVGDDDDCSDSFEEEDYDDEVDCEDGAMSSGDAPSVTGDELLVRMYALSATDITTTAEPGAHDGNVQDTSIAYEDDYEEEDDDEEEDESKEKRAVPMALNAPPTGAPLQRPVTPKHLDK